MLFANVKDESEGVGDVLELTLDGAALGSASSLGFFIIPDGGDLNPGLANGDAVTFEPKFFGFLWNVLKDGTPLDGAQVDVLFSDRSLNPLWRDHERDSPAEGNMNWEDLVWWSDRDFNDVNLEVSVDATFPPNFDDVIDGGRGDDVINGGIGNDDMKGGRGDDTFVFVEGDGNDLVRDFNERREKLDFSDEPGVTGLADLTITDGHRGTLIEYGTPG